MMNKSQTRILGDNKIIGYQQFVLIIGILLVLIFTVVSITKKDTNFFLATIIIALFYAALLVVYSKIYNIEYDKSNFYLRNIFSKQEQKNSDFIEIKNLKTMPFIYVVCFKDKKYYFLVKSDEYFKNLFKSKKRYAMELTENVKKLMLSDEII